MIRRVVPRCLVLAFVLLSPAGAQAQSCSDSRLSRPLEYIRQLIRQDSIPSISIGVALDGRLLCAEAFGYADLEARKPALASTRYAVASVAKPFVATGIMLLVERGKISLDSSVNHYLPADARLTGYAAEANSVTVRHLLQHRGGLPSPHVTRFLPGQAPPVAEAIRRYAIVIDPPGQRYGYSNLGYGVLAFISSRLAGKRYDRFLQEELFRPLGLEQTTLEIGARLSRPAARIYGEDNAPIPYYVFDEWGSGRIWSTPTDLIAFGLAQLGETTGKGRGILADSSRVRMVQDRQSTGSATGRYGLDWFYALGWGGRDSSSVSSMWYGHDGGMPGSSADLKLLPARRMVVTALSNSARAPTRALTDSIIHALVPRYAEMSRNDPVITRKQEDPKPLAPPDELIGQWRGAIVAGGRDVEVTLRVHPDSTIQLRMGNAAPVKAAEIGLEEGRLNFDVDARLPAPDLRPFPDHTLWFSVTLRGDSLSGAATAYVSPSRVPSVVLPHWVSLRRVRAAP